MAPSLRRAAQPDRPAPARRATARVDAPVRPWQAARSNWTREAPGAGATADRANQGGASRTPPAASQSDIQAAAIRRAREWRTWALGGQATLQGKQLANKVDDVYMQLAFPD